MVKDSHSLTKQFWDFVQTNRLFSKEDKLLVGISGGSDSVALGLILHLSRCHFAIAHVNYRLRPKECDADAQFVKQLATTWNVPFHYHEVSESEWQAYKKQSLQEAARNVRYAFFEYLRDTYGYDFLLTAHTKDDVIETLLFRFFKGAHASLLQGIPMTRGWIRRPLLFATKAQIKTFLTLHQQPYREDSSNRSVRFQRNWIRHQLIPLLKALNPAVEKHLYHQLQVYTAQYHTLKTLLYQQYYKRIHTAEGHFSIDCSSNDITFIQFIQIYLYETWGFSTYEVQQICQLIFNEVCKQLRLRGWQIVRERQHLHFFRSLPPVDPPLLLEKSGVYTWSGWQITLQYLNKVPTLLTEKQTALMDAAQIRFPLLLRPWQPGDKFQPLGMNGKTKKVKAILTDMKVPSYLRKHYWVLEDALQRLVLVADYRVAEFARITSQTKKALKVQWRFIGDK